MDEQYVELGLGMIKQALLDYVYHPQLVKEAEAKLEKAEKGLEKVKTIDDPKALDRAKRRKLKYQNELDEIVDEPNKIEQFLLSDEFKNLTELNGEVLLEKLKVIAQREADNENRKKCERIQHVARSRGTIGYDDCAFA